MRKLSKNLLLKAETAVETDEDLIVLTVIASLLASFGIFLNNDFILIGSMLIAPFFYPVLSVATFIAGEKSRKAIKSFLILIFITFFSFLTSLITYFFLNLFRDIDSDYLTLGTQAEYFFVALLLGSIGILLWMWPKIPNISAGISIGISLVPPIANAAKSLLLGEYSTFIDSLTAYSINLIGILIGATVTLFIRNRVLGKRADAQV